MSKLLIVDSDNRAWAAFHAYERLTFKGKSVSMIYGLPSMIKGLLREFEPDKLIMVWDGERSSHRINCLPQYKGERKHKGLVDFQDFLKQKTLVRKILYYAGVPQIINPKQEADDMIHKLVRVSSKKYDQIVIVSGDKDFHQMVRGKRRGKAEVVVFSESRKKLITKHNCKEEFGYHPDQTIDYLTLMGDKSDNIPGYRGMGKKRINDFFKDYYHIADFLSSEHEHSLMEREKLLELVQRNRILINLSHYYRLHKEELKIMFYRDKSKPKIQRKKFLGVSAKYGMNKFMSSGFLNQFKIIQ